VEVTQLVDLIDDRGADW